MKIASKLIKQLACLGALAATLSFTPTTKAVMFDNGVDSENLGKGDWIYYVSMATNKLGGNVLTVTNIPSLMAYEKSQGITHIIVKAGTGSTNFNGSGSTPQFNSNLVYQAHAAGLKIFGYTRSYGSDVPGEIALASYCYNLGADGFVLDAEAEWESNKPWIGTNGPALALQLAGGIKTNWPTKFLAHAPMPIISFHSSFPYKQFGYYCDAVMPQDYWYSFGKTPSETVDWMDTEWAAFHSSLTGVWTNAIKPIAPVGQADTVDITGAEVTEFVDYVLADPFAVTAGGYKGCSFWRADLHSPSQWTAIKNSRLGDDVSIVNHIVIDNPDSSVTGSWSTATSATNKFGTNYRYKSQGTGTAYAQYTPNIVVAGDYKIYEWHTAGANRTTNAPHVIAYNGGMVTVYANQKNNDGGWNLLGTYNFATGTGGYVRITDAFSDAGQIVMSDGIKFVFDGSTPPPSAPSGLSASAVSSSQINLSWTDNSANETGFIVGRSTTSGGPYSDIATLGANTTSYNNTTGLSAATTYYYVVRAYNVGGSSANSAQASATTFSNPPAAPSGLSATTISTTQIGLSWTDNSANESNFIVGRSTTSGGSYTDIATLAANITSYTSTNLATNTTYYYVVRASNSGGASANSGEASATTLNDNTLIDNLSASVVGTWSTGTSSADKYASDYRFTAQGSGTAYLKYTPYIATAGSYDVYEYHPQGSNRTTNAPHVITYNGGTQTVYVNQKVNGGQWNLIGTYSFAVGTTGNVKITDAFSDGTQVVMADAIKFVPASGSAPTAPSGLSATAISSSRINLAWTDNSSNESNFIVARSTISGGPYVDIATLAANTTSYSSQSLNPNITYYYVVRATNGVGSSANSAQASATTYKAAHVNSITMSWVFSSGSSYKSRAVVNVKDSAGANINAATVTGNFTGSINNAGLSGTTGSGGNATITSTSAIVTGTVTYTVTNITGTAISYDSAANVVSSGTHSR